jgi:hypothetical protein
MNLFMGIQFFARPRYISPRQRQCGSIRPNVAAVLQGKISFGSGSVEPLEWLLRRPQGGETAPRKAASLLHSSMRVAEAYGGPAVPSHKRSFVRRLTGRYFPSCLRSFRMAIISSRSVRWYMKASLGSSEVHDEPGPFTSAQISV